jgi:2-methylcitrate dehydratase PrpD
MLAELAEFLAETRYADIPGEARRKAKVHLLDTLAVALAAGSTPQAKACVRATQTGLSHAASGPEIGGQLGYATSLATRRPAELWPAIYTNSYLANLLDWDDSLMPSGHPGAVIVPPALALAEGAGATGGDVVRAVALAYEVFARIALALAPSPEHHRRVYGFSGYSADFGR